MSTSESPETPDHSPLIEMDGGNDICAMTFAAKGEHLAGGDQNGVQVWRVNDGQRVAAMRAERLWCLTASRDGRWLAAGTYYGEVIIWDGQTSYEQVFAHKGTWGIRGVDFSPDSTRLIVSGTSRIAIWDFANRKQVQTLRYPMSGVVAAKYSPQGDRIAIATDKFIRILDSSNINDRFVAEIRAGVTPDCNTGLVWFDDSLFVVSGSAIKRFDTSTKSPASEWAVPDSHGFSCIALPQHAESIAYSTNRTVTFWNISTQSELGIIHHPHEIRSISVSPDDHFLAIGGEGGKITVNSLSHIVDSFPLPRLHPTFQEPDIYIDDDVLALWETGRFKDAEALLTAVIETSGTQTPKHHVFAARALIRAHLQDWDAATVDAEEAVKIWPSLIAYIAKSMALVGKGERRAAYRNCDIAFERFHLSHVSFLLLIKAILAFKAGEHLDAISRMKDLIDIVRHNSICYVVQAYMYLLQGNSHMDRNNYKDAIQSFENAQTQLRQHKSRPLSVVSLISGWRFDDLDVVIRRHHCDALYEAGAGYMKDALQCFQKMTRELGAETNWPSEHCEWARNFRKNSIQRLEHLGDTAVEGQHYDEAISHYTAALSLDPPSPQDILIKRSRAFMVIPSWDDALDDANQVIEIDRSSPWGWEMKHAALHEAGDYANAVHAFETMYSIMEQSTDLDIQRHRGSYKNPSRIRKRIRRIVEQTLQNSPRVLIDTATGHLHNRTQQITAFESLPTFNELISSMTTRIDRARIRNEVQQYFQYVMLSHKWEENEPLFDQVLPLAVYDLDQSLTHDKLTTFCEVVREAGFHWAWSDTCCINKSDPSVLQEALVAMFRWYQGAALVIVFLRGVGSSSRRGALVRSDWNTRAWTLQEYIAAKVVRFYTEDWTPYLNLQMNNHKEAQEVVLEMARATGISAQQLRALRPGLTSIREKLRLASTRETTLVEDAAYSLLGILSVTGLSAIYGEGEASLGRLLSQVLTTSGDASILAWTGESGQFNSCLPARITVFKEHATSHLPPSLPDAEMENIIAAFPSSFDFDMALRLYDRLYELHAPWFVASRMKLPCIAFELPPLPSHRTLRSGHMAYCVDTAAFGVLKFKTRQDLSQMGTIYLIHPWLDTILQRERGHYGAFVESVARPPSEASSADEALSDVAMLDDDDDSVVSESELSPSGLHSAPLQQTTPTMDRAARARRLVARLRQPFGGLLVTLASGQRSVDFRRVAVDSLIVVQLKADVPLAEILANVRTLDIL